MNDLDTSTALTRRARELAANVIGTSRRGVLCGAFGVSAAAVLTACGGGTGDTGSQDKDSGGNEDKTSDGGGGGSKALAKETDIPEGGGKIVDDLVIVQPEKGTYQAFDRACTHKGVPVEAPKDGVMTCPKHGSKFNVDGTVAGGPATKPLNEVKVTVKDGEIFRA